MKPANAGAKALAVVGITFLLSGGVAVYAASNSSNGQGGGPPQGTYAGLSFALVPLPVYLHETTPANDSFKQGGALLVVSGDELQVKADIEGSPTTSFTTVIQTAGQNLTVGSAKTGRGGEAQLNGNVTLTPGTYMVGVLVFVSGQLSSPAGVSIPRSEQVTIGGATQNTTSTTSTRSGPPAPPGQPGPPPRATNATSPFPPSSGSGLMLRLTAAPVQNEPRGYRIPTTGVATVFPNALQSEFNVQLSFQNGNPSTSYQADLVLNGSSYGLGSLTTDRSGGSELQSNVEVAPGTYLVGIQVYDVSDQAAFGSSGPVLVLVSQPASAVAVLRPSPVATSTTTTSSTEAPTTTTSSTTTAATTSETTINAGTQVQQQINSAVQDLTIPATVQVTPLSSSTTVLDSRFSVSVGQLANNGLVIAISGENVTGPRTLLINMSKTSPLALYPALNVTLDGQQVAEASSAVQVLNPVGTNPPYYVLVATSNSIQLLVSIPHFSTHLIQVAGVIVHEIASTVSLDGPLLVGSVAVVTMAFLAAYASRKRYLL